MPREIDEKKKRKALRKLRKAAERAAAEGGPGLSDWEKEFVEEVETRVEKYGSAFADPTKGQLDEPLSARQTQKLKEIDKKSRGKASSFKKRSGFKSRGKKAYTARVRDIHADIEDETPRPNRSDFAPKLVQASDPAPMNTDTPPSQTGPATRKPSRFKVIEGGKDK